MFAIAVTSYVPFLWQYLNSPEEVEETENFNGEADDGMSSENEEKSNSKNDGTPQFRRLEVKRMRTNVRGKVIKERLGGGGV